MKTFYNKISLARDVLTNFLLNDENVLNKNISMFVLYLRSTYKDALLWH